MKFKFVLAPTLIGALFIALFIGGAWPQRAPVGIPDAGVVVGWLSITLRAAGDIASLLVFGLLVHVLFVLPDKDGELHEKRIRPLIEVMSWIWLIGAVARIVIGLADELGVSVSQALDPVMIQSYLTQTSVGRYLTTQLVLIAILVPALTLMRRWFTGFFLFLITSIAVILPVLTGHSASASNHALALGAISIHLWAVGAWLGVLVGLWRTRIESTRVSSIALGAVITVAATGIVNVWVRFTGLTDLVSPYGRVVLLKTAVLLTILLFARQARAVVKRADDRFLRVVGPEILLMLAVITISAVLSRMEPPIPRDFSASTSVPPAPSLLRVLTTWSLDGFSFALVIVMVLAYLAGVKKLRTRGDVWPLNRTIFFLLGAATFFYASNGGLAAYAKVAFSFHMIAHMFIVTLAPIGIVLGAPITLALRTLLQGKELGESGLRGHLQRALNSKPVWLLSHPIWALAVFDGSLFGLYFTGLFSDLMRWHVGHAIMDIHFLAVGLLFFYTIIGIDPNPHRTPYLVRIVLLLAAMSLHAFFSVAVMSTTSLLDGGYFAELQRPWSPNLLDDQHLGGSIGWALGEIPIVLALIATFIQWVRADDREAKRIDRAADRARTLGEDDELAAYNQYLQQLANRDQKR